MLLTYYKKGTLHDYLGLKSLTKDYLGAGEVLRIFLEICDAVKYLHNCKPEPLVHRDLKTANVCLTDNLAPVIMDFGESCACRVVRLGHVHVVFEQDP